MARALRMFAATLLFVSGCSMFQGHKAEYQPVSDADYGRLSPDQLGPLNSARDRLSEATDEVARVKLRAQQADNEVELARADQAMANAAKELASAELKSAGKSNAPDAKAKAQEDAARAELQSRSARAHLAWANQVGKARDAELQAAERLVKVREAELEQAKLESLVQAKIPAAAKYDASLFEARVAEARKEYLEAEADAKARMSDARQGENTWRTLHAQYRERMLGATPAATASGSGADETPEQTEPTPAAPQAPPPAKEPEAKAP
jgi:hypothetical protein